MGRERIVISCVNHENICSDFRSGASLGQLADKWKCSVFMIYRILHRQGVLRFGVNKPNPRDSEIEKARELGLTCPEAGIPDKEAILEVWGLSPYSEVDSEDIRVYRGTHGITRRNNSAENRPDLFGDHDNSGADYS